VALDIDFRPDQWDDPRAFGVTLRSVLRLVDIVIGTEDEINAAMLTNPAQISLTHSQISDARVSGDIDTAIATLLSLGPRVLAQKRGGDGSRIHVVSDGGATSRIDVPGFPVQVHNILGAGDAFASGLLCGFVKGWDWYKAARLANACGAIMVTKHGCANFMATYDEVTTFIESHGGF
jgi:5-dehydro-2-deoxygluconokinase